MKDVKYLGGDTREVLILMRQAFPYSADRLALWKVKTREGKRMRMSARVRIRFYRRSTQCMNPVSVCYINCAAYAFSSHVEERDTARPGL